MDLNKWNDIANKAERVKAKYAKRLSGIQKNLNGSKYICPWCGKIHDTRESHIRVLRAGTETIDRQYYIGASTSAKTYVRIWYNIRCCEKCYKWFKIWTRTLYTICIMAYIALGIFWAKWLIETEDNDWTIWIASALIYAVIGLIAYAGKNTIEECLFNVVDVEKAYKNNAIEEN